MPQLRVLHPGGRLPTCVFLFLLLIRRPLCCLPTVLDDNKKLCLVSGEIIQLSSQMTMMFEVEDLVSLGGGYTLSSGFLQPQRAPAPQRLPTSGPTPPFKSYGHCLPATPSHTIRHTVHQALSLLHLPQPQHCPTAPTAPQAVASPATVSRCGMVYMEPSALGLEPLLTSWLARLPPGVHEHGATLAAVFRALVPEGLRYVHSAILIAHPACRV